MIESVMHVAMTNYRKLYYFHIQHDRKEMGRSCPPGYVNADDEWQAIEETLENLPTPNKMYNDTFPLKTLGPQDVEIMSLEKLICFFISQPYLGKAEQELLKRTVIRSVNHCPRGGEIAVLLQLICDFASRPSFSNNDRVLLKLAFRGTDLVKCESQGLHVEFERCRREQDAQGLLRVVFQRNQFIAGQIALSLKPGETGVLFLGHLHGTCGDMVKRLKAAGIPVEEGNECRASHGLKNLLRLSPLTLL